MHACIGLNASPSLVKWHCCSLGMCLKFRVIHVYVIYIYIFIYILRIHFGSRRRNVLVESSNSTIGGGRLVLLFARIVASPLPDSPVFQFAVAYPWPVSGATESQPQRPLIPVPFRSPSLSPLAAMVVDPKKAGEAHSKAARTDQANIPGKAAANSNIGGGLALAPFIEAQVLTITNSIQFETAIETQLNKALLAGLHQHVPGVLKAELPNVVGPLLAEQRASIQQMLDGTSSNLDGKFREVLVALQPAEGSSAAASTNDAVLLEVRAVGEK